MNFLKGIQIFKVGEKIGKKGWLLSRYLRGTLTVFPDTTGRDLKGLRKVVRALCTACRSTDWISSSGMVGTRTLSFSSTLKANSDSVLGDWGTISKRDHLQFPSLTRWEA